MNVAFAVLADGEDISHLIADRLLYLSVTDEAGITSDAFEVALDNRDGRVAMPATGAELEVSLGYDGRLVRMGRFSVDEVEASGPPDTLTVRGKSSDMADSLKSQKTRDWDNTTLGAIIDAVAREHGLTPACHVSLRDKKVEHLDQTAESDLHLLTRLADEHAAIFKPADGYLVFCPRGICQAPDGAPLPTIKVLAIDVIRWRAAMTERQFYRAVKAKWRDKEANNDRWLTVGEGEPVMMLRQGYRSEAEAMAAADGKLRMLERGRSSLSLTMPGYPEAGSEHPLWVIGLSPLADGEWIIQRAEHRVDASGFVTTIEAQRPEDLMDEVEPGDDPAKPGRKPRPSLGEGLTDAEIAELKSMG